jgi:Ca-activated chloride channel family protein
MCGEEMIRFIQSRTLWARLLSTSIIALILMENPGFMAPTPLYSQEAGYVLSVDVELVSLKATVTDESGKYIEGLTAEDFRVLENGQEHRISFFSHDSRVPVSVGALIDISGSLQDKLEQGLQTVSEIAATLSPNDEMFVITFNSRVDVRQKFTNNPEDIQHSLHGLRAKGETAVYDAISAGLREMQAAKNRKQILLLVSDGFDSRSKINAAQAESLLRRSTVALYAIGIDDDDSSPRRRHKYRIYDYMLGKLTSAGSGRFIRLYAGRNYDLRRLSELLLGELHQEYTMGYYPAAGPDSETWRSIEVRVTKPGARILGDRVRLEIRGPSLTNVTPLPH